MTNITIRQATAGDLPGIIALLADDDIGQTREDSSPIINPRYISAFAAIAADPNQFMAVAEDASGLIGCMQLSFIPGLTRTGLWRGQIEGVRIAASRRGSGAGRIMLAWAIDACRDRGCGLVQLTTDKSRPAALRFYETLGFKPSHEGLKLTL